MRRAIIFLILLILTHSINSDAQNASWLQRSWKGKAYTLGNDPKNYDLLLTINKIKGKSFEGVLTTIQSSDTSVRFNTKISGSVNDNYLQISMPGWKVKCGNCAPQTLAFSMESGRFFLKGEAKGCYIECTWITVFSEDMMKFNTADQQYLAAVSEKIEEPEQDTTAVAQNTTPPKDNPVVKESTPQRIVMLPAGDIVFSNHDQIALHSRKPTFVKGSSLLSIKENSNEIKIPVLPAGDVASFNHGKNTLYSGTPKSLKNSATLEMQQTTSEVKLPLIPAGDVALFDHGNSQLHSGKPGSLKSSPSLAIQKNIDELKIPLIPAGDVVLVSHKTTFATPQKVAAPLNKNISMTTVQNTSQHKLPPSIDSIASRKKDTSVQKQIVSLHRDSVSLLPQGYAERKKNVIRTLIVNTDSIILRVYDNGVVDGDIVSVIYNDKVVIDKLSLTSHAVVVKVPVTKEGINTLVFHAHNLGEYPPNTAELEILYGNKKEELTVSSDLTVSSMIDVEYQK